MKHYNQLSRLASLLVAAFIITLTLIVTQHVAAVGTTPNAAFINYNLAGGAKSAPITPAANQATLVMGTCTTPGFRGVGFVTMERSPGLFLQWVGLNSNNNGTITQGFSGTAGTQIVQIDFDGFAFLEVNTTDTFVVHNTGSAARAGNVLMIF